MSPSEITSATNYNKKHLPSEGEANLVQSVVGAKEDGIWGELTVEAVAEWQRRRDLYADGKVGPDTWDMIQGECRLEPEPAHSGQKPVHGIWVDDPRRIKQAKYWDEMQEHGISSIALMFEGMNEKFNPFYSYDSVEAICKLALERNMQVGITDWPWPNERWMNDMYAHTRRMFDRDDLGFPLAFHESDVEGNWKPKNVRDFINIDKAGNRLVDVKSAVVDGTYARMETTSFTSHTENGRAADVAPHMDAVFNQGYAVRSRRRKNKEGENEKWLIPWSHTYGPGNMVKHTLDRSLQIPGIGDGLPKLGAGLAAYDQKWPGHSGQEAMLKSYEQALTFGVFEVRWWSFKWIFGKYAKAYGKSFLKSVR
ncbi:MAG: hypothetical protein DRQ64_00325 [Gammaproteobacteria bacterium]|nr:MAG: hypothetical protein DRQ64_00325 [Gammaproteobacteria bacterium]